MVTSYFYRIFFTLFVYSVSFTSRSTELLFVTIAISLVYTCNYVILYISAPFYSVSQSINAQNGDFVPYKEQDRIEGKTGGSDMRSYLQQGLY